MPAFQLSRLKAQISELVISFTRPEEFKHLLIDMFEQYANRGYRPGHTIQTVKRIPAYNITPLILYQIEVELAPSCEENPGAAMILVEELRKHEYLETKLLAAALLGKISLVVPGDVFSLVTRWAQSTESQKVLFALFDKGCWRIRHEMSSNWYGLIESWVFSDDLQQKIIGINALIATARDQSFDNLPPLYRLLSGVFTQGVEALHSSLLELIEVLIERSETETLFFIRQEIVRLSGNQQFLRFVRRCLPVFSVTNQASLKQIM